MARTTRRKTAPPAHRYRVRGPRRAADLASELDLPLGVVQILLADLRVRSLIAVHHPTPPAQLPDAQILREVADGLRRL
jgi:hypothetical protein